METGACRFSSHSLVWCLRDGFWTSTVRTTRPLAVKFFLLVVKWFLLWFRPSFSWRMCWSESVCQWGPVLCWCVWKYLRLPTRVLWWSSKLKSQIYTNFCAIMLNQMEPILLISKCWWIFTLPSPAVGFWSGTPPCRYVGNLVFLAKMGKWCICMLFHSFD